MAVQVLDGEVGVTDATVEVVPVRALVVGAEVVVAMEIEGVGETGGRGGGRLSSEIMAEVVGPEA